MVSDSTFQTRSLGDGCKDSNKRRACGPKRGNEEETITKRTRAISIGVVNHWRSAKRPPFATRRHSRPRAKDVFLKSTPRFQDTKNTKSMVPRRCEKLRGGPFFLPYGPPKKCCSTPIDCTKSGLLPLLLRLAMERFLSSAGGSSAAGLKPCGEPTCKIKSVSSEGKGDDGKQESRMKSTISEAEVRSRSENVLFYLYANGRDDEYSETTYLLSKTVHWFTRETQVRQRAKEGGEAQATLRNMCAA